MKKKEKFHHSSKRKDTRFKKKYKEESNEIIFFECRKPGHMKVECPQLKKKVLWWQEKKIHMKPIKSTSSVHYGMQMNLIFKHFGVSNNGEPKDDEILSWVAKKVVALRLNPQPRMETACTCFDEESAQNKEKKKKKKNKEKKRRRIDPHPLLTKLIRSVKRLESRVCRSPLSKLDKVKETLEEALDKKIVSSPTVEASSLESEIS